MMRNICSIIILLLVALTSCNQESTEKGNSNDSNEIKTSESGIKSEKQKADSTTKNEQTLNDTIGNTSTKDIIETSSIEDNTTAYQSFINKQIEKEQTFSIDNSKDEFIKCKYGTILFFPAWSFNKSANNTVKLKVKEFYDLDKMILNNLTTTSAGKILETKGMINIEAYSAGNKLSLREGQKIIIHFPKNEKDLGMSLFKGKLKNNQIDWKQDASALFGFRLSMTHLTSTPNWRNSQVKKDMNDIRHDFNDFALWDIIENKFNLSQNVLKEYYSKGSEIKIDIKFAINNNQNPSVTIQAPTLKLKTIINKTIKKYIAKLTKEKPNWRQDSHESVTFSSVTTPLENYKENFQKKYSKSISSNIQSIDFAELKYYVFQASELGWINCDRFINSPAKRIDYAIKVESNFIGQITLKAKDLNSLLPSFRKEGFVIFKSIPKNLEVKIIAIKMNNEKPYLAIKETRTSENPITLNNYKEFSISELQKQLN